MPPISGQHEEEYRGLVEDFVGWCRLNHLQLNISKMREPIVDFHWTKPPLALVSIHREDVEVVRSYNPVKG